MDFRVVGMMFGLLCVTCGLGCADRAGQAALREDEPATYSRYLREHADSDHVVEARERLDYHLLKRDLSREGFDTFVQNYPGSSLVETLHGDLEPHAFARAQSNGTGEAYRAFASEYPDRARARRAEGNAAYIDARGFSGNPGALASFAERFPESDFAREAVRTNRVTGLISRSRFYRVGLRIALAPGTPEPERVRAEFRERAASAYRRAGVELVELPDPEDGTDLQEWPRARLTIQHSEAPVTTRLEEQELSRPGHRASTEVSLSASPDAPPVFQRTFELRVDSTEYIEGTSVLFSTASPRYWEAFFTPVATAQTQALIRPEVALHEGIVDVDASQDRSVVLFEGGRLKMVHLADPAQPQIIAEFARPADFKQWSGVRMMGHDVVIFGEEGLERVHFGAGQPKVDFALTRREIGTVFDLEPLGGELLIAGSRGLLMADPQTGEVQRLMRRVIKGCAVSGEVLVLIDAESVYISSRELLAENRVYAQLSLGKSFDAVRVLSAGSRIVVLGGAGVVTVDLQDPASPRVVAKLLRSETGHVWDAVLSHDRVFLLGERGLLLMGPGGHDVVQSVDVEDKTRVTALGRHVVVVGNDRLQVVDTAPLREVPAQADRR